MTSWRAGRCRYPRRSICSTPWQRRWWDGPSGLATRPSSREVYGHILDYARRFPLREMGVMLVSDMHRAVGQEIFEVPQFADWAQSVSEVMLFDM